MTSKVCDRFTYFSNYILCVLAIHVVINSAIYIIGHGGNGILVGPGRGRESAF